MSRQMADQSQKLAEEMKKDSVAMKTVMASEPLEILQLTLYYRLLSSPCFSYRELRSQYVFYLLFLLLDQALLNLVAHANRCVGTFINALLPNQRMVIPNLTPLGLAVADNPFYRPGIRVLHLLATERGASATSQQGVMVLGKYFDIMTRGMTLPGYAALDPQIMR